jgi:hypothetical protein
VVDATTRPFNPRGKRSGTQCTGGFVSRKAGMDGCGGNPLRPLGLENWTDQPVTSRYTDHAIPALQFTLVLCVHTDISKELFVPYLGNVDEKHCILLPCEFKRQITRKRRYILKRFYGGHMSGNNSHLKH